MFGKYKPEIEGFPYDQEKDQFICAEGKILSFKTYDTNADGGLLKIYRPFEELCKPENTPSYNETNVDHALKLRAQGKSFRDIEKETGVPRSTLSQRLNK